MAESAQDPSLRILIAFYEENARQARYHGERRQAVTAVVALCAAIILAFRLLADASPDGALVGGGFLAVLGVYGFLASFHHHERARLHVERLHAVREALWSQFPGEVGDLYGTANEKHRSRFPVVSEKTARIHYAWQLVHLAVGIAGLYLVVAATL